MTTPRPASNEPSGQDSFDFSLVLGGPLYQLWRRTRLSGDALELLHRRVVVFTGLAWVPLLILSFAEGHFWGGSVARPFLHDVGLHVRLLVTLPLLIVAELVVHRRMRPEVRQFVERGMVPSAVRQTFDAAVASALRLRNSIVAELLLLAFVYLVGVGLITRSQAALGVASWYGVPADGRMQLSLAGWWLTFVSLPLFQLLLLRWYFRVFIWARFLWQVSRLELALVPTHPDRCGGLGFLGVASQAFVPLLFAQGALLSGVMANRVFFAGAKLPEFKLELVGLVAMVVLAILGPLLFFSPRLEATKRAGLREYGTLARRYVLEFDHKWLHGGAPPEEPLVGTADIQSLADLGNSYEVVRSMRWVPFTVQTVLQLSAATLAPVLPLMLTMVPLEELIGRLLKIVF